MQEILEDLINATEPYAVLDALASALENTGNFVLASQVENLIPDDYYEVE